MDGKIRIRVSRWAWLMDDSKTFLYSDDSSNDSHLLDARTWKSKEMKPWSSMVVWEVWWWLC